MSTDDRPSAADDTAAADHAALGDTEAADTTLATASARGRPASGDAGPFVPGDQLGRYRIEALLGAGGMGVVYRARDADLNRDVAIKLLQPTADGSSPSVALQQRLLREAQAMAQLSHPNLVTVYDVGTAGDQVFIAMEFIDGATLREYLADTNTWQQRLTAVKDAGRGLVAAHAAGVVHRDFKPDNVFVAASGRVRVGDFGLARSLEAEQTQGSAPSDSGPLTLTRTGTILGTPAYMSPEQHRGEPADARSDQFSFAVTAYEALYGQRPFAGDTSAALLRAIEAGDLAPAPAGQRIPAAVHNAVVRALRADPEQRFDGMQALLDALDAATQPSWSMRRKLVAGAVVALVALAAVVALRGSPPPPGPPARKQPASAPVLNPQGRDYQREQVALVAEFADTQRLAIQGCYQRAWRAQPLLRGVVTITVGVGTDGKPSHARVHDRTGRITKQVIACLRNVVARAALPPAKRKGARLSLPFRMTPPLHAGIKRIDDRTFEVRRGVLERLSTEPQLLASGGVLVKTVKLGNPVGYKIFAINPASIYAAVGLHMGDTITAANGLPLTSPDQLKAAYQALRTAAVIKLSIVRKGKPVAHVYRIRD